MTATAHAIYAASVRQFAGLELERQGHLEQIAGLRDERTALRDANADLAATNAVLRAELDRALAGGAR